MPPRLGQSSDTSTEHYIMQQIDELHEKGESLKRRLAELKELTSSHALADIEFDLLAQMPASFKDTVDGMTVEQKRATIRTFTRRSSGTDAHVVLFGSEYKYKLPKTLAGAGKQAANSKTTEPSSEGRKSTYAVNKYRQKLLIPISQQQKYNVKTNY